MANRKTSRAVSNKTSQGAVSPGSPTRFYLTISLQPLNQHIIESKMIDVPFPCTFAELTYQLASAAFTVCEELAAKAGVKFLPEKELRW